MTATTYDYEALCAFATALGESVGLPPDRARMQSEILLEADLMGHTTHGLALLPGLLKAIESGAFARNHTKTYLYRTGQSRRIPICPVNTPRDILTSRQLDYRGFFVAQDHTPSGRKLVVPGAPYRLDATPWRQTRPAPRLGEHTSEILAALGYGPAARAALLKSGVVN